MLRDPGSFIGRTARIRAQEQFPGGAYRAPSFLALHEDIPQAAAGLKAAEVVFDAGWDIRNAVEAVRPAVPTIKAAGDKTAAILKLADGPTAVMSMGFPLLADMVGDIAERAGPAVVRRLTAVRETPEPQELAEAVGRGDVAPGAVAGIIQQAPRGLRRRLQPQQETLERQAHRSHTGEDINAPISPLGIGTAAALGIGIPYGLSRLLGKLVVPKTLRQSAGMWIGPKGLLPGAVIGGGILGLHALRDPLRQQGKRGWGESLHEGLQGQAEGLLRRGDEARAQYGAVPGTVLQAGHFILNPLPAVYDILSTLKGAVVG
jgi:hypothetical protein